MRISSDFKDYYDNLINLFNSEVKPVYVRKTKSFKILGRFNFDPRTPKLWREYGSDFSYFDKDLKRTVEYRHIKTFVVGFCGELYLCYQYHRESEYNGHCGDGDIHDHYEFVYTPKRMEEIVALSKSINPNDGDKFYNPEPYKGSFHDVSLNLSIKEIFKEYNTPSFILELDSVYYWVNPKKDKVDAKLIINPKLEDYGFVRVIDTYTAIQKLNMYLSTVLVDQEQMPCEITDDKVIQKAKGFDHEYSFRKEPGKKNRKANKERKRNKNKQN